MPLKDFGKAENDLGLWFPFGHEGAFDVRIRRIPYDVSQRINKQYGREQIVTVDGVRRPHIERNLDEQTKWLVSQAAWAWTDVREGDSGLKLEVSDEEAARLWAGLLKRDSVSVGDTIEIGGGLLTEAVKQRLLMQLRPYATMTNVDDDGKASTGRVDLATFIILTSSQIAQDFAKAQETARGN